MVQKIGMKNKIIIITGATGVGKSTLAIDFCKKYGGEIVSADSMQVYKGMDIGTAKATLAEREIVKHHLIDVANIEQYFTVSDFLISAKDAINDIVGRKKIPVIVGGTGLYLSALMYGHNFSETKNDETIRKKLKDDLALFGAEYLHGELEKVDILSAQKIEVNDTKRVIRALEIYYTTGKPKSKHIMEQEKSSDYNYCLFVLDKPRNELYEAINCRVDTMIKRGLVDEVKKLITHRECNALKAIAYKELFDYIDGKNTLEECIELLKKNSRHYAKRQLTYFRAHSEAIWLDAKNEQNESIVYNKYCTMPDIVL